MDALEMVLADNASFPNGIYWCMRDSSKELPGALQSIAKDGRVYFVDIEGFDEMLAEIHSATRLDLPDGLSSPFKFTSDRSALLIDSHNPTRTHPTIAKDIAQVMDGLSRIPETISEILPVESLAMLAQYRGNKEAALGWWQQAYDTNKSNEHAAFHVCELLADLDQIDKLREFIKPLPLIAGLAYCHLLAGNNTEAIRVADEELAQDHYDDGARINKAIALRRLSRHDEKEVELARLQRQIRDGLLKSDLSETALLAGIAALRGNREELLELLDQVLMKGELTPQDVRRFPVFELYKDDEMLKCIVDSYERASSMQIEREKGRDSSGDTDQ